MDERKIKKLIHTMDHTVAHFDELINEIEQCNLDCSEYINLKEEMIKLNNKILEQLK